MQDPAPLADNQLGLAARRSVVELLNEKLPNMTLMAHLYTRHGT